MTIPLENRTGWSPVEAELTEDLAASKLLGEPTVPVTIEMAEKALMAFAFVRACAQANISYDDPVERPKLTQKQMYNQALRLMIRF